MQAADAAQEKLSMHMFNSVSFTCVLHSAALVKLLSDTELCLRCAISATPLRDDSVVFSEVGEGARAKRCLQTTSMLPDIAISGL